jgi:uncharacterized protein involved in exopolysaccharide biosynthesis
MAVDKDMHDDEIDLRELFHVLFQAKKFIFLCTSAFAIIGVIYSLSLNNIYTSKTTLIPTALSQANESYSDSFNLPSFAGIDLSENDPNIDIAIAYINSVEIVQKLISQESFLPDLMASTNWHLKTNELSYDDALYDVDKKKWVRDVDLPFNIIPSSQEAYEAFSKLISISHDRKSKLVRLSVDHISPFVAKQWAIWIVEEANKFVADLKLKESEKSIEFLNEHIKATPYTELRTKFYELIQQKTQNMMLAKVNPEYVLTTIDPPLVAEIKSKPKRALIFTLSTLLGIMVSVVIVLFNLYYRGNTNQSNY